MKNSNSKLWLSLFIGITVFAFMLNGCQLNDSTGPESLNEAPDIPPSSTLVMDFSDFKSTNQATLALQGNGKFDQILSTDNWRFAAGNVAVWNTLITIGLITPVAAFLESFKHQPEQQPDNSWVWTYDFYVFAAKHTAELHAKTISVGIRWDMYISKENGFNDYHWFFGESNLVSTEGFWTLNGAEDAKPTLLIEWHRNPGEGTSDIKYTNVIPDGPENGGYIYYGITNDTSYDADYDIYNKGKDNLTNIMWNRTTKEGRVKDLLQFGDSDWHCWDITLQDFDCQ